MIKFLYTKNPFSIKIDLIKKENSQKKFLTNNKKGFPFKKENIQKTSPKKGLKIVQEKEKLKKDRLDPKKK